MTVPNWLVEIRTIHLESRPGKGCCVHISQTTNALSWNWKMSLIFWWVTRVPVSKCFCLSWGWISHCNMPLLQQRGLGALFLFHELCQFFHWCKWLLSILIGWNKNNPFRVLIQERTTYSQFLRLILFLSFSHNNTMIMYFDLPFCFWQVWATVTVILCCSGGILMSLCFCLELRRFFNVSISSLFVFWCHFHSVPICHVLV